MKKLTILITVIILFSIHSLSGIAALSYGQNSETVYTDAVHKEIQELKGFTKKVDRFIIYTQSEEWGMANRIKMAIIKDMRREIKQTKQKVRVEYRIAERGQGIDLYRKNRESLNHKRNKMIRIENYKLKRLNNRLDEQMDLYRRLRASDFGRYPERWSNAKKQERIMLLFEETLREDIRFMQGEIR